MKANLGSPKRSNAGAKAVRAALRVIGMCVCPLLALACSDGGDGSGSPPGGGNGTPIGDGQAGAEASRICVDKINAYRATLSLPPLARWSDNESCVSGQAKSDSETGKVHGAFGKCSEMAQNECPGWKGPPETMIPDCLAQMWAEGPGDDFSKHGHYITMSSNKYTKVACGFYTTSNGKVWAIQDFR
ncbi:CAP domain-containing protein [Pendulispora albinea]|uniref:CAP domain-containing protein n=1 Tax=Pendulispora albinea TaxID=2741071 RepID=A0ABZ2LXW4_9BACT